MIRRARTGPGPLAIPLVLALFTALAVSLPASAEDLDVDLRIRGLLDLVAGPNNDAVTLNLMNAGGSPFDPWRGRLFVDATPMEGLDIYTQFHLSDESGVFIYGAYANWAPWRDRDFNVQAGKIPWPIGQFGPRTYSDKNPLVGTPLLYQYHSSLRGEILPPSIDALLSEAGNGQYGVNYVPGPGGWRGMPILYDFCWDFGAAVIGSARPFEYSLAVTNGTPSSANPGRDTNDDKSVMGRVGLAPLAGLRFGVAGSTGAYLPDELDPALPPGETVNRYDQNLVLVDAEYAFSHFEVRGEWAHNEWETPTVGDLALRAWYVEGKYAFPVGAYVAVRYDQIDYDEVQGTPGPARPWDDYVRRIEAGLGYRFARKVLGKVVYQSTTLDPGPVGESRTSDLVAGQLSLGF